MRHGTAVDIAIGFGAILIGLVINALQQPSGRLEIVKDDALEPEDMTYPDDLLNKATEVENEAN